MNQIWKNESNMENSSIVKDVRNEIFDQTLSNVTTNVWKQVTKNVNNQVGNHVKSYLWFQILEITSKIKY